MSRDKDLPAAVARTRDALVARVRQAIPNYLVLYLYGSMVRVQQHAESDLDLALLLPRNSKVPVADLFQLRGDLESLVGRPVDVSVLDLDSGLVHCKEVVAEGIALDTRDEVAREDFEMQTLSRYAEFAQARRPVVEAYQAAEPRG